MKVQSNTINFKGYDARPLKGFIMKNNYYGIADEMQKIGKKEKFKVFSPAESCIEECSERLPEYCRSFSDIWAQDLWTITKQTVLYRQMDIQTNSISEFFNLKSNPVQIAKYNLHRISLLDQYSLGQYHISGGNVFIVKGDDKDEVLIGESELHSYSEDEIKEMYGVDKITVLPQMDYHLDLFIRPLDKKRILLADDSLTERVIQNGIKICKEYGVNTFLMWEYLQKFRRAYKTNSLPQADEIEQILKSKGFETIRVPGRIYSPIFNSTNLSHDCNYINANVLKNKDGDLVYITNKSRVDLKLGLTPEIIKQTGFSIEKSFIDSISSYVKPEHIYFVSGESGIIGLKMLPIGMGGIHCVCSEVPAELEEGGK